jgi:ferredoxin
MNLPGFVEVTFLLDDLVVRAPEGTPLQAIADHAGADLTFGCRGGSCGTCRVRVVRGLENLSPATPEERDFLASLEAPPDHRLACQVCVNGDLDIEYLGL